MFRYLTLAMLSLFLAAGTPPRIPGPAATVQQQIERFNAHDLAGFLALFAEDLEVAELPAGPAAPTGKARLRELYAERFRVNPELRASALEQVVCGSFVIQKERISGRAGKGDLEAGVIYLVKEGRIVRMWGLRE